MAVNIDFKTGKISIKSPIGAGLMGKKVTQAVRDNAQMNLVGVVSPVFDAKIDEKMYASLNEVHEKVDAIIDFSHPDNLNDILKFGVRNHCALVLATTGYSEQQILHIEEASSQIPIFQSNFPTFPQMTINLSAGLDSGQNRHGNAEKVAQFGRPFPLV